MDKPVMRPSLPLGALASLEEATTARGPRSPEHPVTRGQESHLTRHPSSEPTWAHGGCSPSRQKGLGGRRLRTWGLLHTLASLSQAGPDPEGSGAGLWKGLGSAFLCGSHRAQAWELAWRRAGRVSGFTITWL